MSLIITRLISLWPLTNSALQIVGQLWPIDNFHRLNNVCETTWNLMIYPITFTPPECSLPILWNLLVFIIQQKMKHWILLWFHTKIRCVHELIENLLTRYNNLRYNKKKASKQAVKIWVSIQHFKVKVIKVYWRLEPPNAYWFMLHLTFKVTACHTVVHFNSYYILLL